MNIPAAAGQAGDLPYATVVQVAKAANAQVGLLATQETSEAEDNAALDETLPSSRWQHFTASSENDLLVKRDRWALTTPDRLPSTVDPTGRHMLVSDITLLSKGKAHVSPHRDLTHAALNWTARADWDPFVFCGTHLVSGVYAGNDNLDWRKAARSEEFAGLHDNIAWWLAAGLNVLLCLDSNWPDMPPVVPGWVWAVQGGHNGIDKIGYVNAPGSNWEFSFLSHEVYANASDHDFQVANLRATGLTPPPTPSAMQRFGAFLRRMTS